MATKKSDEGRGEWGGSLKIRNKRRENGFSTSTSAGEISNNEDD